MATVTSLQGFKQSLVRKSLGGSLLFADSTQALPTSFTTGTSATLADLTGFTPIGLVDRDNAPTVTPETETSDINAWGVAEPVRTDIISKRTTISWTGLETHLKNLELYHGIDLSANQAAATTGEFSFTDPSRPELIFRRLIFFSVDGSGADEIYRFMVMPRFIVTEVGEQTFNEEGAITYPITGRGLLDEDEGYAVKYVFGGPGWKAKLADMGITQAV